MLKVTYGSKFNDDPWSYEVSRYSQTEDVDCYRLIGCKVSSYLRRGATKVTIKVERL